MSVQEQIAGLVKNHSVCLFMKGTRMAPQCGFSATVVEILDEYGVDYHTVNILEDPGLREGIKAFSNWPTIPQLYVNGEFVGGCDITREMHASGELAATLGAEAPEVSQPNITVTDSAKKALLEYAEGSETPTVRLEIDRMFQHGMDFDAARPGDVTVELEGLTIAMDRGSARRADGLTIDFLDRGGESGFKIDNPNEPPRVRPISATQLKAWMDEARPMEVFDVRSSEEHARASIAGARLLDDEGRKYLVGLDRNSVIVLHCHHGMRSQTAGDHLVQLGFRNVYNLNGGIDAWSIEVDASVPRY